MSTPKKYRITIDVPFVEEDSKESVFFEYVVEAAEDMFGEEVDMFGTTLPNQAHMDWCKGWLKNYLRLTGKVNEVDLMEMVDKIYEELCL